MFTYMETKTEISSKVHFGFVTVKVKVKQSRYRPGVAQKLPESSGSQIS